MCALCLVRAVQRHIGQVLLDNWEECTPKADHADLSALPYRFLFQNPLFISTKMTLLAPTFATLNAVTFRTSPLHTPPLPSPLLTPPLQTCQTKNKFEIFFFVSKYTSSLVLYVPSCISFWSFTSSTFEREFGHLELFLKIFQTRKRVWTSENVLGLLAFKGYAPWMWNAKFSKQKCRAIRNCRGTRASSVPLNTHTRWYDTQLRCSIR